MIYLISMMIMMYITKITVKTIYL